jgi:ferrous iron transport protein B
MEGLGIRERLSTLFYARAEAVAAKALKAPGRPVLRHDPALARPWLNLGLMLALFGAALWVTLAGAGYPSALLAKAASAAERALAGTMEAAGAPAWLRGLAVSGAFRAAGWVVSVMLPPMAIFFPIFTLLEDVGYLPRIAFTLDRLFSWCGTQGKQALTMGMALGCNATGIYACRIIEGRRGRLCAALTNVFTPCNGRLPLLVALAGLFFGGPSPATSLRAALVVAGLFAFGMAATLATTFFLGRTFLRGEPSFFVLELVPYRRPRVLEVLLRSLLDRTLVVGARALTVAAPAGAITWLLANTTWNGTSLLAGLAGGLDAFARCLGLDGCVLSAFLLGWPANETVLPILLMMYLSHKEVAPPDGLEAIAQVLSAHGWTGLTAFCFSVFSLLHFPCATTFWTMVKEIGGRWALAGLLLPSGMAVAATLAIAQLARLVS